MMLVGCNREEPNGYFATGENAHRPRVRIPGRELRALYRSDSLTVLVGPSAKDVVGEAMKPGRSPNDFSKE
jgi:hypothetical protein